MTDIEKLLILEDIKQLKYRYFRAVDLNDWDLLKTCMTKDCVARYDGGKYSCDGIEELLKFLSGMNGPGLLSTHQGHHPEITIKDANTAEGVWYLQDMVINLADNTTLRGAGFYEDHYVKQADGWKIKFTGYERTYEEVEKRSEAVKITCNNWS